MLLAHCEKAYIPEAKLRLYLLSETHPVGRTKARFFRAAGYHEGNIELLEQGLLGIARTAEVTKEVLTEFGTKYSIDGVLWAPSGKQLRVCTIWIVEQGQVAPRFVTAFPA